MKRLKIALLLAASSLLAFVLPKMIPSERFAIIMDGGIMMATGRLFPIALAASGAILTDKLLDAKSLARFLFIVVLVWLMGAVITATLLFPAVSAIARTSTGSDLLKRSATAYAHGWGIDVLMPICIITFSIVLIRRMAKQ